MEKQEVLDYWSDNIKEFLLFAINDIFILWKEIEWSLIWIKSNPKMSIKINVNWRPYIFSELSNYFNERDFLHVPIKYVNNLYKLLLELRVIWQKIEKLDEKDKISILDFVTDMIKYREKQIWNDFCFPQNYKDMIMMELWLDIVDKLWDATNETLALLEVIMLKR